MKPGVHPQSTVVKEAKVSRSQARVQALPVASATRPDARVEPGALLARATIGCWGIVADSAPAPAEATPSQTSAKRKAAPASHWSKVAKGASFCLTVPGLPGPNNTTVDVQPLSINEWLYVLRKPYTFLTSLK